MTTKTIELILTQSSIDNAIKQLEKEKKELNKKINEFVNKMAEQGVSIAIHKINELKAVDSGELVDSMNLKKGEAIQHGSVWYVYTDCEHAPFVEFGTGTMGEESGGYIGEFPDGVSWKYNSGSHIQIATKLITLSNGKTINPGEKFWIYKGKDGRTHATKGMPSRPFMYETTNELKTIIKKTAKEVFG